MQISFTIPGDPKGKDRPRFNYHTGHTYTTKKTEDYEEKVRGAYYETTRKVLEGPISADIIAYFKIPVQTKKADKEQMRSESVPYLHKPDADNIAKVILDALNHVAYEDDIQVYELRVRKFYSKNPRVEVTLNTHQ